MEGQDLDAPTYLRKNIRVKRQVGTALRAVPLIIRGAFDTANPGLIVPNQPVQDSAECNRPSPRTFHQFAAGGRRNLAATGCQLAWPHSVSSSARSSSYRPQNRIEPTYASDQALTRLAGPPSDAGRNKTEWSQTQASQFLFYRADSFPSEPQHIVIKKMASEVSMNAGGSCGSDRLPGSSLREFCILR